MANYGMDAYGTQIEAGIDRGYSTSSGVTYGDNSGVFDDIDSLGYAKLGISLITGIANAWNAHESNKIAKETLAFNKDQYAKQYESFLSDRARRINRQNHLQDSVNRANGKTDDSHWRVGANPAGEGYDTIGQDGTNYSQMSEEERNKRNNDSKSKKRKLVGASPAAPAGTQKANKRINTNNQVRPQTTNRQINQTKRKL